MQRAARDHFQREDWKEQLAFEPSVDVRYSGQGYELNIPFTARVLTAFHEEHQRRYGYNHPDRDVELVTLRLRARMRSPQPKLAARGSRSRVSAPRPEVATIIFDGKKLNAPVYERANLQPGRKYAGPAVVAEYSATTAVPPGLQFGVDKAGNLLIDVR